jgi:nucleoside-diphosphate-sugar epimerase
MSNRADGLAVVLGAGGGTGRAVVDELVRLGRRVRAVTRSGTRGSLPGSVEVVAADLSDPAQAVRAIDGASVVYHAAQPPYNQWAGNFERLNDSVARACGATGARLVFADNLYMYGPGGLPMTESTLQRATDRKGALRASLAADLLARHKRGEVEVAIGRSSDYFGPFGRNTGLGERLFGAAVVGKSASWGGALDQPHSTTYLPDLARALVVLGERDGAVGRAWHLPVMDPLTGSQFGERLFAALGRPGRLSPTTNLLLLMGGLFMPMAREARVVHYQWQAPFVSDWSAFETAFGPFERTPLDEALAATIAWWRDNVAQAEAAKVSRAA